MIIPVDFLIKKDTKEGAVIIGKFLLPNDKNIEDTHVYPFDFVIKRVFIQPDLPLTTNLEVGLHINLTTKKLYPNKIRPVLIPSETNFSIIAIINESVSETKTEIVFMEVEFKDTFSNLPERPHSLEETIKVNFNNPELTEFEDEVNKLVNELFRNIINS